jgi:hypothetical protein
MDAVRTSEMSVDNHFTRQYIPEDNSEHHTRRRENLKSHIACHYLKTLLNCQPDDKINFTNQEELKKLVYHGILSWDTVVL